MIDIKTLDDVLQMELQDLYSAETQIAKALSDMIEEVSDLDFKAVLQDHLCQAEIHLERLDEIGGILNVEVMGNKCAAMVGLIDECVAALKEDSEMEALVDALIISRARRVKHFEIVAYMTARSMAQSLEYREVVKLLSASLEEEQNAEEKLGELLEKKILPAASGLEADEDVETDEDLTDDDYDDEDPPRDPVNKTSFWRE